jgi:hypothetical protein
MAAMVKLGLLILVASVFVGICNGLCRYEVSTYTSNEDGAGTDAPIIFKLYDKEGLITTRTASSLGGAYERGSTDTFTNHGERCADPCRITLALHWTAYLIPGSTWIPDTVDVNVYEDGLKYQRHFLFVNKVYADSTRVINACK